MKGFLLMAGVCLAFASQAQQDSTRTKKSGDTIRVGNLLIVTNGKTEDVQTYKDDSGHVKVRHHNSYRSSNISTNWVMVDLGFTNFHDKTVYPSAAAQQFAP